MANDLTKYFENRERMRTGDLLTYRTNGAFSWAIRRWSPGANHAGMVLDLDLYKGEEWRRWTMEATKNGPRLAFLSGILSELHGECYWHRLKPDIVDLEAKRCSAMFWALEQQGVVKYDFKDLLLSPLKAVSADVEKLLCSEYVQISWAKGKIITMEVGARMSRPSDLPEMGVTLPPIMIVCHKPMVQVPLEFETVQP